MLDYTVIVNGRQQFGDKDLNIGNFVGEQKQFSFNCPGVNASQPALLLFQSFHHIDVGSGDDAVREQSLEINGSVVFGGIPSAPFSVPVLSPGNSNARIVGTQVRGWVGNVLLVTANTLKESNNVMRIASVKKSEFVIDNVVLLYKTKSGFPDVVTPIP